MDYKSKEDNELQRVKKSYSVLEIALSFLEEIQKSLSERQIKYLK